MELYVRPSVRPSTFFLSDFHKLGTYVVLDKWFTTVWPWPRSKVKVKVTGVLKLRKVPFSKSISSINELWIQILSMDYDTREQYLKSIGPDFRISIPVSCHVTLNFGMREHWSIFKVRYLPHGWPNRWGVSTFWIYPWVSMILCSEIYTFLITVTAT
jgi:hypothetical protein